VAVAHEEGFQLLLKQGFSERDAKHLAETHETAIIRDQVNWLERRNPTSSRLGLLRRAIEENWEEPTAARDESETDAQGASPGAIFAACYYAGFHGSDDEPAAAPSTNDIKQAERFIEQISEMTTGEPPVAEWGRALGRLHAEAQPSSDAPVISCVVALRRHGDALKQKLRTDWERKRQEAIDQAKAAHRTKHRGVYSDYLRNCEAEIKTSDPDGYAAFETHRAEERARIERNRFFSDERRVQQLAAFDRVERRLKDFQEFPQFEDVLSFEAWDAKLNSEPFREDEVTS
jgi:hypothetical protein